jgi:hypothetical protein
MIGPGPVSPGTLKYAVPFIKTHVILFEEKSGVSLLGTPAGCARNACQTAPVLRRSTEAMLAVIKRRDVVRALIDISFHPARRAVIEPRTHYCTGSV